MEKIAIVTPVFNDWTSFSRLVEDIGRECKGSGARFRIIAVDDGSTEEPPATLAQAAIPECFDAVECLKLAVNIGHQRAISVGMATALDDPSIGAILIMDADGEDRPSDIAQLLEAARGKADFAVVAERRKRTERFTFRLSYMLYKTAFTLLTGRTINFGNYSLISREYAKRLCMVPDLWNNLAAALIRSRIPITRVPLDRGKRYAGSSKMSYTSLIVHGLSAVSVFSDAIFVRMLIATAALFAVAACVIATVVFLRLFTTLTTPGWATTVVFGTTIILTQVSFTTLIAVLLLLNTRSQRLIIPALDYRSFIELRSTWPAK